MEKMPHDDLPSKAQIKKMYEIYTPYFETVVRNVEKLLEKNIALTSPPMYKARVKSFESYYKKNLRLKIATADPSEKLARITDVMGVRIICAFLEDIAFVLEQVKELFEVREVERKGPAQNFKEFEYESVHILVKVPPSCLPSAADFPELSLPDDAVCEIQIRTILQDAWAEVEHELVYKNEFTPFDLPLRRKLAAINASLNLADIIFQEIRDYQKKLQVEMNERRRMFYEKVDELDSIKSEIVKFLPGGVGRVSPYVKGTVDDMLLDAIHAHNTGDLQSAIKIYTQILESASVSDNIAVSAIHRHRGMAYFTESEYEKALDDFRASVNFNPKDFRSLYYEGLVLSILKDNRGAIEKFTESLAVNEFQSHAFYHRAEAYYEEGEYEASLSDMTSAKKLGMNDEASKALRAKILERI